MGLFKPSKKELERNAEAERNLERIKADARAVVARRDERVRNLYRDEQLRNPRQR